MKKIILVFAIFIFAISFAWTESPIQLQDAMNREIILSAPATKVISLVPAITEILFAIGAEEKIVGITEFCNYPEETNAVEKVGGFSGASVSIEKIISLKPDLVFVSADMHFRIIDLLEQVGIKTFAIEPRNMSDIFLSINDIGLLTHCIDSADQTILRMKEKLDKAKELFLGKETVSVFWEIWNQPLRTAGPNTFINEAITLAGGKNIFDDVLAAWPEVSVEQVIIRNPQWIMSDESHAANITQEALSQRPLWSGLDAVRNKRIGIINADMIMRGGPRLADAIWQMAELFHGEKNLR